MEVMHRATRVVLASGICVVALWSAGSVAQESGYGLNPGDVLQVSVWKEAELTRDVLVRPDGKISFPLVGDIAAAGSTPEAVQGALAERLQKYIPDPVVTVSLGAANGNKVYVLGKVARPGEYVMVRPLDVMNTFASENKVVILRRDGTGKQQAIPFRYAAVQNGEELQSNIILSSGDIVVVP
jgi:polysaccharide export outer membrane protein